MSKGKLIVLEGIDGSGKSTQYKMLCDRLSQEGIAFKNIVFPRYNNESSSLIRMYLGGKFGTHPDDVNAYTASTFFSVDRFASYKEDWGEYYENGGLIFADRYTTSNAVHQGCKVDSNSLNDYFSWLSDLEYNKMKLPKPDLVIYLDVSLEISRSRMRKRELETDTAADIHEKDEAYLERCLNTADSACRYFGWERIPYCYDNLDEISIDEKNSMIYKLIKDNLNARY